MNALSGIREFGFKTNSCIGSARRQKGFILNLILTADDFGRSPAINQAVLRAHRQGVLTAASLMVSGEAFGDAVRIARDTPTLAVGLHLVLADGRGVLPADRIPQLVNADGCFPNAPARLGMRYFFDPRARRQVALEMEAQFERFAQTGLPMAHVDGHQHMHLHPAVFPLLVKLATQYGAAGVRVPRDDLRFALRYNSQRALTKILWAAAFGCLGRRARRRLAGQNLAVADRVYGLMQSGHMDEAYVISLLERARDVSLPQEKRGLTTKSQRHEVKSTVEIYFHPTTGPRTDDLGPNPGELQTLLSPDVRRTIEKRAARLCSYADLREGTR
ncbi:MAG TPA: hopanoid biosynthesis-associated protein HpnK [Tepidisphaeraceae bacterium]|nr:hopanoid biosynthesis-associated protein HpnK [Tepidisphaeraceae bacterium]